MGIDFMIRGMANQKPPSSRPSSNRSYSSRLTEETTNFNSCDQEIILDAEEQRKSLENEVPRGVSFLAVPSSPDLRRPSTADVVIEKLQVEKMEGGGMYISGVAIVANCHFTLMIFGLLFLLAGIVLTYIGFGTGGKVYPEAQAAGAPKGIFAKHDTHHQMQIIGPIFLAIGVLMVLVGVLMFFIHYKVSKDDKRRRLARSAVQIHQLENSFSQAQALNCSPIHTVAPSPNYSHPIMSLRRGSWWMEPTPIEEPQTPSSSLNAPDYNQNSRRGSRSSSPIQERNTLTVDWPSFQQEATESNQNQIQYIGPGSQLQNASVGGEEATKKPSVTSFLSYSFSNAGDIATFPGEDINSFASFPIIIHPPDEERPYTTEREFSPDPSVYSLYDRELNGVSSRDGRESAASSFASAANNPQMEGYSNSTEFKRTNSEEQYADPFPSGSEVKALNAVPRIQVGPGINHRVIPSFDNTKKLMIAEGSSTRNLPLSKNGVALPRLSRHSVSSRPPDISFSNRPETSFSNQQDTPFSSPPQEMVSYTMQTDSNPPN